MQKKHLVLVGYMAAGKTQVAKALSVISGVPAVDLDKYIETTTGLSPAQWITQQGEIAFRKVEHQAFNALCMLETPHIIATGGGTPCYANNAQWLQHPQVFSVYVQARIPTLLARLQGDSNDRPLAPAMQNPDEAAEALAKHLFERMPFYTQAQFTIATDDLSVSAVAEQIWAAYLALKQ